MENGKKWYKSKTIIFNVLSGIVGTVATLQSSEGIPPHLTQIFSTIVLVGNIILRLITDKPITK